MKQIIALFLVVCLLGAIIQPAYAAEPQDVYVTPRYIYIDKCYSEFSINESTGIATCKAYCYSLDGYTVQVECKLQRYVGSFWGTIKTWTDTGLEAGLIQENWAVYSGYTYRLYTTIKIMNSAGVQIESEVITKTYSYYPS